MGWCGVVKQQDETDCGAACLATIARFYNKWMSIATIRQLAGTDTLGTSGLGIVKGAEKLGFLCKGARSPDSSLRPDLPVPLIAHIRREQLDHYIVVHKVKKNKVLVGDPAFGVSWWTWETFQNLWSGVFFIFQPDHHFVPSKEKKNLWERFLYLLIPHKRLVVQILLSSILLTLVGVIGAFYYRYLIDEVIFSGLPQALHVISLGFLALLVFQQFLSFTRAQIVYYLANKIDASLTFEYFFHLLHLPMAFFTERKTGEILSRLQDTTTIRQTITGTTMGVLLDSIMLVVGGVFLYLFSSQLVGIAMIPVILSGALVWLFMEPFKRMLHQKAVIDAEKHSHFVESINGISTIKALSTEKKAFERAEVRVVESINRGMKLGFWGELQSNIQAFLSQVGNLTVFWVGSWFIIQGEMSLGELISFNLLLGYFLGPLGRLITLQPSLQEAWVASDRLGEILEIPEEKDANEGAITLEKISGDIEFQNVTFSYGTRGPALEDVSFSINAGQRVALVGPSGSGKTTLTKLLLKFYSPDSGQITIDGHHIQDLNTESYRSMIGYVPQDVLLFSGTIAENISWGVPQATPQQIFVAAVAAQAEKFISKLPERFATRVGERGATLSGGERQRISLARILLRQPSLLILDEATSSLDSISEDEIMKTIDKLSKSMSTIIIAHRLSTIKNCDVIFVFEEGKLIESGNHDQLLLNKSKYFELWSRQNG